MDTVSNSAPPETPSTMDGVVRADDRKARVLRELTALTAGLLRMPVEEMDVHAPFLEMGATAGSDGGSQVGAKHLWRQDQHKTDLRDPYERR